MTLRWLYLYEEYAELWRKKKAPFCFSAIFKQRQLYYHVLCCPANWLPERVIYAPCFCNLMHRHMCGGGRRVGAEWGWKCLTAVAVMSSHFIVEHADLSWAVLSSTCSFHPRASLWKLFAVSKVVSGVPVSCVNVKRNTLPPCELLKISRGGIGWRLRNTRWCASLTA